MCTHSRFRTRAAALSLLSTTILALGWAPAKAQQADPLPAADTITVTATRNPIRAYEFPGMVSVVGPDAVTRQAPSNPSDLFFSVPGTFFSGGTRRTGQVPTIRGFGGSDVIVLIDGTRQDFVTAHDGRFYLDPSFIKRVDVVRGPVSTLYGSGGLGGAIAFGTLDAEDILDPGAKFGFRTQLGTQSVNGERLGTQLFAIRPLPTFTLLGGFTRRPSGPIRLGDGTKLYADDDVRSAIVKGTYDDGTLKVQGTILRFQNTPVEPNNPQAGNPNATLPLIKRDLVSNTYNFTARYAPGDKPWLDFGFQLYRVEVDNAERPFTHGAPAVRALTTDGFTIDNRSRFALGENLAVTATYGVEGTQSRFESSNSQLVNANNGTPAGSTSFFGAFLETDFAWTSPFGLPGKLNIQPGVRFDSFESDNPNRPTASDQAVSPKIGISYAPVEWAFVFASAGRAFRAPTITELYADGVHFRLGNQIANFFVPNPSLRPQTSFNLEAGFGLRFDDIVTAGDRFRFKTAFFQNDVSNLINTIVVQPTPPGFCFAPGFNPACPRFNGTTTIQNVGKARIEGVEVEASYDAGLAYLNGNLTIIDGKDKQTNQFVGALAPTIGRIDGGIRLFDRQLTIGSRLTLASDFRKANTPAEFRGGYGVLDVYASLRPKIAGLTGVSLDIGVDNVLDRQYDVTFTSSREPGRNYKALVGYQKSW